jgi:hypothetical protein
MDVAAKTILITGATDVGSDLLAEGAADFLDPASVDAAIDAGVVDLVGDLGEALVLKRDAGRACAGEREGVAGRAEAAFEQD